MTLCRICIYSTLGPYIARRRTSEVQKKYAEIGGGSPILKWTNLQVKYCRPRNGILERSNLFEMVSGKTDV